MMCLVFSAKPWMKTAKRRAIPNLLKFFLRTLPVKQADSHLTALRVLKPARTRAAQAMKARRAMTLRFSKTANSSLEIVSERGGGP